MNGRDNASLMKAAHRALREGRRGEARNLFELAVKQDPEDHRAWLSLSGLAPTPEDRLEYIERAARLRPDDPRVEAARRWAQGLSPAETQPLRVQEPETKPLWRDAALILAISLLLLALVAWGTLSPPEWARPLWWAAPLLGATRLLAAIRLPLGLAYVLFVPGYCLAAALFPRSDDLDGIERAGLSLGLSIALVPVLALILDKLPWGLRLLPILVAELAAVLLFLAIAMVRRALLPRGEAFAPSLALHPGVWWRALPTSDRAIYRLGLVALLLAGLALAWVFLVPSPAEFMTEFYVLGPEGLAEGFPRQAIPGEPLSVTLGLANREREARSYRVEIWVTDPWQAGRRERAGEGPARRLVPGEQIEWPVSWAMPWAGPDQLVEFLLFLEGEMEPYRRLRLFVDVKP
jgi:uncharacterized membrane protein